MKAVVLEGGPSSTADLVSVVGSFPAELNTGGAGRRPPPVNPAGDSDEPESACVIKAELDERRSHQVECFSVPKIHFQDPPSAGQVDGVSKGFPCLTRHHRGDGMSGFHFLERIGQYFECGLQAPLAAPGGLVIRVGGDESEQVVEPFGTGGEDDAIARAAHLEHEALTLHVEEHQPPQRGGQLVGHERLKPRLIVRQGARLPEVVR